MENQAYHFTPLEGFDGIEVAISPDKKNVTFRYETSSGVKTQTFQFPAVVECGKYTEGQVYYPGDMAKYDGETWHCNVMTNQPPTAQDTDWTQATGV